MEDNKTPIEEFDLSFIEDFFRRLDRQGPGCPEQTVKALSFIPGYGNFTAIADIGCGTGGQTKVIAEHTGAHITGLDFLPRLLDGARQRMEAAGYRGRFTPVEGSMTDMPFEAESFDLIWAEGSIYNIGFEKGLSEWRKFLRPEGFITVNDTCWLGAERPAEMDFITENHTEIATISEKCEIVERAGYRLLSWFALPPECWTTNYYEPLARALPGFLSEKGNCPAAVKFAGFMEEEITYYKKYGHTFGYVFFIAQRTD